MGQTASALEDDDTTSNNNVNFYTCKIPSKPNGGFIDDMHKTWLGDWDLLEAHHGYVQWLFPIREGGMNFSAQPLSKHEAAVFRKSADILKRAIKSYELMLDFYGMVLKDKNTGELARNPKTFNARYMQLNSSFHNFLRITRVCKFLGIIGLEHYKKQFLRHMAIEVFKHRLLRNADESCIKYWIPTLRKSEDLKELDTLVEKITGKTINRDKIGYGDEDGVNWATQYYACECAEFAPPPQAVAVGQEEQQQQQVDIATHDTDPFEDVHKKFESKTSSYFMRRFDDERTSTVVQGASPSVSHPDSTAGLRATSSILDGPLSTVRRQEEQRREDDDRNNAGDNETIMDSGNEKENPATKKQNE